MTMRSAATDSALSVLLASAWMVAAPAGAMAAPWPGLATGLAGAPAAFGAALATGASCRVPADLPRPPVPHSRSNPLPVAGYQLVLSWSPHYCENRDGSGHSARDWDTRFQCQQNHFGWVVHGLWPQADGTTNKSNSPRACRPSDRLPKDILRANLCTMPGVSLMQHEWSEHGTCVTGDPRQYFGTIQSLLQRFPTAAMQIAPGQTTVGAIRTAITRANPALLRPQHIGLRLDGRHLKEAYLCLDLRQTPTACTARQPRDDSPVTVD